MSKSSSIIVLDQRLIKSKVWLSLSGTAINVFLIFRTKCQIGNRRRKQGAKGRKIIINNGEIVFTYDEAEKKYGITHGRFNRAIDDLVAKGFIDISDTGMGLHKMTTYYSISDRWEKYGTSEFRNIKRPKAKQYNAGFKLGNELWKRRKEKITVKNDHGAVRTNNHGGIVAMRTNEHGQKIKTCYNLLNGQWLATKIA